MKALRIAPTFTLPLDAITQTFGLLAVRRAGKSNAAAVMAEQMFEAGLPFVVIDPKGDWWGLRSSKDGKGPGLPIPIFGGDHQDVPLERTGGVFLAELIVEQRLSCVVDVSELSEGDKTRFLIDFAERLYRKNRDPLHVFLEEADDYIPQRPFREQARCVGAFERLVKRGGFRGLGITLISQRSAAVNKNVLTQVETLFILRTTSPQDRKAVEAWIEHQGQTKSVLETLPALGDGEAWVYSPHWLKLPEPERIRFDRRSTFDSGATPKASAKKREPATLADVDLASIRDRMAATIERAKAEDPRELRKRIGELERDLLSKSDTGKVRVERIEVPVVTDKAIAALGRELERLEKVGDALAQRQQVVTTELGLLREQIATAPRAGGNGKGGFAESLRLLPARDPRALDVRGSAGKVPPVKGRIVRGFEGDVGTLPRNELAVLKAITQVGAPCSRARAAIVSGYSIRSSQFDNALSALRSKGLIVGYGDELGPTYAGAGHVGLLDPLPSGRELARWWAGKLPKAERAVLEALGAVDGPLSKEEVAEKSGYSIKSSQFDNALSKLRTLALIEGSHGEDIRFSRALES